MKNLFLSLLAIATIIMFSCNKDELGSSNLLSSEEEAIISNDAAAEEVSEVVDYEVDLFSGSTESISLVSSSLKTSGTDFFGGRYRFGLPPVITIEKTDGGFPMTITLDYGEGTELINGRIISGTISIVLSAPPRTNGATRTVTFNNFYVDAVNIAGTRTMTFNAGEGNGITWNVVGSFVITFSDGTYIERETEKTREFVAGYDTPGDFSDDVFNISGFVNSVSSEGYTFSRVTITPLVRLGTCRYIVEGIVQMSMNDEVFAELNYGDGTCDDIATITKDGEERQITLGKRHRIRNL